jgi:hypothetical protein
MRYDIIAPRRAYWRDYVYDWRSDARRLRQWQREVRYGASRFMSSTLKEEIIKCFEQYVHLCSGLGENMMHDIVRQYYEKHPLRARPQYDTRPTTLYEIFRRDEERREEAHRASPKTR